MIIQLSKFNQFDSTNGVRSSVFPLSCQFTCLPHVIITYITIVYYIFIWYPEFLRNWNLKLLVPTVCTMTQALVDSRVNDYQLFSRSVLVEHIS